MYIPILDTYLPHQNSSNPCLRFSPLALCWSHAAPIDVKFITTNTTKLAEYKFSPRASFEPHCSAFTHTHTHRHTELCCMPNTQTHEHTNLVCGMVCLFTFRASLLLFDFGVNLQDECASVCECEPARVCLCLWPATWLR